MMAHARTNLVACRFLVKSATAFIFYTNPACSFEVADPRYRVGCSLGDSLQGWSYWSVHMHFPSLAVGAALEDLRQLF